MSKVSMLRHGLTLGSRYQVCIPFEGTRGAVASDALIIGFRVQASGLLDTLGSERSGRFRHQRPENSVLGHGRIFVYISYQ